jgi:hypothetical protein
MRILFRFFVSVLLCTSALVMYHRAAGAEVVLNEILADPASDWDGDGASNIRDDEWVEILNAGDEPVDLSVYLLADGEEPPLWRYGFAGLLEPGEVRVVYGSESEAWEQANGFPVFGLSLNNGGDRVTLFRIAGGDTVAVDVYGYPDRAAEDDRSIGRVIGSYEAWSVFDALDPCGDSCEPPGNGCVPTPGLPNECLTQTNADSWGAIKTMHR